MYAAVVLDERKLGQLSFKSTPEGFAELIEREGVEPAAYAARYHWVTVLAPHALREHEIRTLLRAAYEIIREGLPKKAQKEVAVTSKRHPPRRGRKRYR